VIGAIKALIGLKSQAVVRGRIRTLRKNQAILSTGA